MENIWEKHLKDYERYLRSSRALSEKTITNYINDLSTFKEYLNIQDLTLDTDETGLNFFLQRQHSNSIANEYRSFLRDFVSWLLERRIIAGGVSVGSKGHSRSSIKRILASIKAFIRYLIGKDCLPDSELWHSHSSQMSRIMPRLPQRLPDLLSMNEVNILIQTAVALAVKKPRSFRNLVLIELLYGCGLRVSEASQLDWSNINFSQATLRVTGKGQKERELPIGENALSVLLDYSKKTSSQSGPLFVNSRGTRLSSRSIQRIIHNYAILSGLRDDIHPHTLRHTYATHLLDGGADLRIVQELLGHSTPSATQVYTHVSQGEAQKVYLNSHPLAKKHG